MAYITAGDVKYRARRSCLSVPASSPKMLAKAPGLPADEVFMDLEDSVAPGEKEAARKNVVAALEDNDWTGKTVVVRVNGVYTRWCYRDIVEIVEPAGRHIDCVMIPKVQHASDITFVADLLRMIEETTGLDRKIGIEAQIENALGLTNADAIAGASDRLETLIFGPGDMAAAIGMPHLTVGEIVPDYPGDHWHWILMRILVAARNRDLQAIDGPYAKIRDLDGFREVSTRARALGYDGKWALHPDQVTILNEVFAPAQEEYDRAEDILEAYAKATDEERRGAVMFGDEMIDEASRKMAAVRAARGRAAGRSSSGSPTRTGWVWVSGCARAAVGSPCPPDRRLKRLPLSHLMLEGGPMPVIQDLTEVQRQIIQTVRDFVDSEVIPVANELEHRDEYPEKIVEQMKEMGLFGLKIPEAYGGIGEPLTTYALVVVELARGWMSLSGILNTHFIAAWQLETFGTEEQKDRFLPRMATGEIRAALSMSEPEAGSDVQAIKCKAIRQGDAYVVDGTKMWVTNGLRSGIVMLLCKTNPEADPPARGMSMLVVEKEPAREQMPGLTIPPNIEKLGYKGVETTELIFEGFRCPARNLLGGDEGQGFYQVMAGIEVGRVNVAARAIGVAQRAFEEAIRYAQQRRTFGKPIAAHQAIQFKLADMATKIEAAKLLMMQAAQRKDRGERSDLEAGMAKLFASEMCVEVATEALRIHGGYGYSKEFTVERLYRDAPFLLIGEGTSEIQKMVIGRQLLERYKIQ